MTTALVEVLQQIVVGCQVNSCQVVLLYNLRNTDCTVLVECVERQVLNLFLHEVFIEVFRDNLLYETVFRLGDFTLGSFPDEHDQIFRKPIFSMFNSSRLMAKGFIVIGCSSV